MFQDKLQSLTNSSPLQQTITPSTCYPHPTKHPDQGGNLLGLPTDFTLILPQSLLRGTADQGFWEASKDSPWVPVGQQLLITLVLTVNPGNLL